MKKTILFFRILSFCLILFITKNTFSQSNKSFDVLKYDLNIDIYNCFKAPLSHAFTASEIISIKANESIEDISLNAENRSLKIESVSGAGNSFTHENNILKINLNSIYNKDDNFDLLINYSHKEVKDSAFYAKGGMVFTDTEPAKARRWFVCKDVPDDKAFVSITSRVPDNVLLCSVGYLADSTHTGDTLIYKWESKYPVATYLIAIIAKVNYKLDVIYWKRPTGENMEVRFYWQNGETMFNLNNVKDNIGKMLDLFSELYGDYPFEKLAFATANKEFQWGGMENQTIIILCPDCWTEELACHELAHHWFGDFITPQTWSDIWLNEGFATFNEAVWLGSQDGKAAFKKNINRESVKYLRQNPGWAIYEESMNVSIPNDDTLLNSEISYSKSSCVLQMLSYVLGDSVFFDCLKKYSTNPEFSYGNANTSQFINSVNETSGKDLNWFFNQWLYKPGHPVYRNNFNSRKTAEGKWEIDYTINQIQENQVFYKMPVELKIIFQNKSDTLIKVNSEYDLQLFKFDLTKEPLNIVFDPDNQILLKETK